MSAATPDQLRNAITEMDSMAQDAFSEIATLAKLALTSLETPEAYTDLECMATVLKAIWDRSMTADDHINATAEGVGCNYKGQAMDRRRNARRKSSLSEVAA